MAHLDLVETRAAADVDALYWWRRGDSYASQPAAEPLKQRLAALAERAASARPLDESPQIIELPGNRLRANAEARRNAERATLQREELNADLLAAIRHERRSATYAVATGVIATAAPTAATLYAAATHEHVALGFALAGSFAASFALYHALRWLLLIRSDGIRKILR